MGREGEATRTNLTFDSTSSDRFPPISQAEYAAISRVIDALPPKESSWEVLYKTSETIGVDQDEPFALFLKLALVSGADWRVKWANAVQSLEERGLTFERERMGKKKVEIAPSEASSERRPRVKSAGGFDLLQAKVDKVTATTASRSRPRSTAPTSSTPLASTSARPISTSHAPPPASRKTRDFLVKPGHGRSSSSDDFVGVPTPQYSGDYTAPLPSSHVSKPLLPTSSSSRANKHASLPPQSSRHRHDPPLSPTPRSLPLAPPVISTFNPDYPTQSIYRATELEVLADDFRRAALLSRSWERWRNRTVELVSQTNQIALLRDKVMRNWVLGRWKTRLGEVIQLQQEGDQAVRMMELEMKRGAMLRWAERVGQQRRAQWEHSLRTLWNVMRTRVKMRLKREMLQKWRKATQESLATRFRRQTLLRQSLQQWTFRMVSVNDLSARLQEVMDRGDLATKDAVLQIWKRNTALQTELWGFTRVQDIRTKEMCWDLWRERIRSRRHQQGLQQVAERVADTNCMKRALVKWKSQRHRLETLSTQADQFSHSRDRKLISKTFEYIITEYSGALLLNARTVRLARTSLRSWADQSYYIATELEGRAIAFTSRKDKQLLRSCLGQWIHAWDRRGVLEEDAAAKWDQSLKVRAVTKWRTRLQTGVVNEAKADIARDFFVHRNFWNQWRTKLARKKIENWQKERERKQKAVALSAWLAAYRKAQAEHAVVASFQSAVHARVRSEYLHHWLERVIEIRARELEADAEYDQKLLEAAFGQWIDAGVKHGNRYSLAKSFRDVREDGVRGKIFRTWLHKAREVSEIRRRLEDALEVRRLRGLETAFDTWRERFLLPLAEEARQSQRQRLLATFYHRWQSRTRALPALRMDRQNLTRRYFNAWRAEVTDPDLISNAVAMDRGNTLAHCFNLWRVKLQATKALRSASRFRSFAASSASASTPAPAPASSPTSNPAPSLAPAFTPTPARYSTPSRGPIAPLTSPEWHSAASTPPTAPARSPLRGTPAAIASRTGQNSSAIERLVSRSARRSLSIDQSPASAGGSSSRSVDNASERSRDDSLRARLQAAAAARRS